MNVSIDKPARRTLLRWIGVAVMTLGVGTASAQGSAQSANNANFELTLLHGTKGDAGTIPSGWPELTSPPFNAYNHYEVLSTKTLTLTKGSASKEALPDGSTLEATLVDTTPKLKVELVLKDNKGAQISKGTYSTPKGKKFLPVSTPHKGGALVVGLKAL